MRTVCVPQQRDQKYASLAEAEVLPAVAGRRLKGEYALWEQVRRDDSVPRPSVHLRLQVLYFSRSSGEIGTARLPAVCAPQIGFCAAFR